MSRAYGYHRPRSLDEAIGLKAGIDGSRYIAGGTDLLVAIRTGCERPPALVSLRSVGGLGGITAGEGLSIGAMTALADIAAHPAVQRRCPLLADAARSVGSVQIRNVATLGGNLCNASPCANSSPPLVVLDAALTLAGPEGERRVAIEDFFLGPGATRLGRDEVVTRIDLAPPPVGARSLFVKQGRVFVDLALVSLAVVLELDDDGRTCRRARVAAGAVAPIPLRLRRVERLLEGQRIEPELIAQASDFGREDIRPISDIRASADYRRHLTGVLLGRALAQLAGAGGEA